MISIYKTILNIIFPQNKIEEEIEELSPEGLSKKLYIKENWDVVSMFKYKDPLIKQMIWSLKYKGDKHVARLFASILNDYLVEEVSDEIVFNSGIKTILVPVPLSKKRARERGFNQVSLITNELQKLGEFYVNNNLLIKRKDTAPQTSLLKREDRVRNIKGAFEVNNTENIKNAHIILIDDVLTTGSTLIEAKKTLDRAEVFKISSITLAH